MLDPALFLLFGAAIGYSAPRLAHMARHVRSFERLEVQRVYVSAPYAGLGEVEENVAHVRDIARTLAATGKVPIAPHLILPGLIDEVRHRDRALRMCLSLIESCCEVRVYRSRGMTPGMALEVDYAKSRGIPVREVWA